MSDDYTAGYLSGYAEALEWTEEGRRWAEHIGLYAVLDERLIAAKRVLARKVTGDE